MNYQIPTDISEIPAYATIAWGLKNTSKKPSSKGLSVDKIVTAAISLADAQGLEGLSIRNLATQLGFTTMAMYRHIANRDELIILMLDQALSVPAVSLKNASSWQEALHIWGQSLLEKYQTHPWILDAPIDIPTTPNNITWLESVLTGMRSMPLGIQQKLDCALLVDGHARNFAHLSRQATMYTTKPTSRSWLPALIDPSRFPFFTQVLSQRVLEDEDESSDFVFGLERIISGIEVFASSHTTR